MAEQATISVSGGLTASIRILVDQYPGANMNRMGRALVRLGLRQAHRERALLVQELRQLDTDWPSDAAVPLQAPSDAAATITMAAAKSKGNATEITHGGGSLRTRKAGARP